MVVVSILGLMAAAPAAVDSAPAPASLPAPVRAMIDAAMEGGNPSAVATILALAKQTHAGSAAEIDALETAWRARVAEQKARDDRERETRLASAPFFANWKGQVELGASRSTGSSDNLGLYGAVSGERQGIKWRHKVAARADIQRTNGVTTTQRIVASWQPNHKIADRLYAYGLAQYEHDRFLGYENRYTAGGGLGYGVIASDAMRLNVEGGPAFRLTDFSAGDTAVALAGRASLDFNWKISPTLAFSQTGSVYLEAGDRSATASTAFDTKLLDALKARFSYNIQYERDAGGGAGPIDTLSRATLIYSF